MSKEEENKGERSTLFNPNINNNDLSSLRKLDSPLKTRNTIAVVSKNQLKPQMIKKSRKQVELREKYF